MTINRLYDHTRDWLHNLLYWTCHHLKCEKKKLWTFENYRLWIANVHTKVWQKNCALLEAAFLSCRASSSGGKWLFSYSHGRRLIQFWDVHSSLKLVVVIILTTSSIWLVVFCHSGCSVKGLIKVVFELFLWYFSLLGLLLIIICICTKVHAG